MPKFVKVNEKIANKVVGGYNTIEKGVTKGYQKIENGFVKEFLARDGETIAHAKKRVSKEGHVATDRTKNTSKTKVNK
ncbi:MAG: hypothetical protein WAW91_01315 [Candidatus Nanoperiomorbaceae bacterium]